MEHLDKLMQTFDVYLGNELALYSNLAGLPECPKNQPPSFAAKPDRPFDVLAEGLLFRKIVGATGWLLNSLWQVSATGMFYLMN